MSTPTPPAPPAAGRRGGLSAWIRGHRTEAAVGGGVGLVLVAVIIKKMRASSAAAAASNAQTTTGSTPAGQAGFYDPSGDYNSLEQQIAGLQTAMAAQTTAPAGSSAAPGPVTQTIQLGAWKPGVPESGQAWNADLNNIAAKYGISLSKLLTLNPQITNPNKPGPAGTLVNVPVMGAS